MTTNVTDTEITKYVEAVAAHYSAIWAAMPADSTADNVALATRFQAIVKVIDAQGTTPLTELPKDFDATLLTGVDDDAKLKQLNEMIAAQAALPAITVTNGFNTEQIETVKADVGVNLTKRMFDTYKPDELGFMSGSDVIGKLDNNDIAAAGDVGVALKAAIDNPLSDQAAGDILNRWVEANSTSETAAKELQRVLNVTTLKDYKSFADGALKPEALKAFQKSQGLDVSGKLDLETVAALRGREFNYYYQGVIAANTAMDTVSKMANDFGAWISGASKDLPETLGNLWKTTADTAGKVAGDATDAAGKGMDGFFKAIGDFIGGTTAGGWVGALGGGLLAWFASNMFGAGPFRMIMMVAAVPLMAMLGRDALNGWDFLGGDKDKATGTETKQTAALALQPQAALTPEAQKAVSAEIMKMLETTGTTVEAGTVSPAADPSATLPPPPKSPAVETLRT